MHVEKGKTESSDVKIKAWSGAKTKTTDKSHVQTHTDGGKAAMQGKITRSNVGFSVSCPRTRQ